jgi:hypothetical protein
MTARFSSTHAFWGTHASRVLVSASRRNSLSSCSACHRAKSQRKVCYREDAFANTRDAYAPRNTQPT